MFKTNDTAWFRVHKDDSNLISGGTFLRNWFCVTECFDDSAAERAGERDIGRIWNTRESCCVVHGGVGISCDRGYVIGEEERCGVFCGLTCIFLPFNNILFLYIRGTFCKRPCPNLSFRI